MSVPATSAVSGDAADPSAALAPAASPGGPVIVTAIPQWFVDQVQARVGADATVVDLQTGAAVPPESTVLLVTPPAVAKLGVERLREAVDRAGWVHFASAGIDGFPLELLAGRTVTCSRGANSVAIAELTVGLLLAAEKRMPDIWESASIRPFLAEPLGTLMGRTVGLIGFGTIGAELARRLDGFGTRLVALRRRYRPAEQETVTFVRTLPELLGQVDHLVVMAPLTSLTDRLLNDEAFALTKPGVHVVNVARGRIVDTDALVRALAAGIVSRATLDVTDPEPLPAEHPLRLDPRVRILPHVSWSAPGRADSGVDLFLDNLRRLQAGLPLDGLVDLTAGY